MSTNHACPRCERELRQIAAALDSEASTASRSGQSESLTRLAGQVRDVADSLRGEQ